MVSELEFEDMNNQQNTTIAPSNSNTSDKVPFLENPLLECIGLLIMSLFIALSNAGGLSGAGTNIPIMLLFFDMEMS